MLAEPECDLSQSQDNAGPVYSPAQIQFFLSLLCTDYKILSKALAFRLGEVNSGFIAMIRALYIGIISVLKINGGLREG